MHGQFSRQSSTGICARRRQGGGALILFALSLIVILGVLGLAIDSGLAYLARARLSLAADSAVLAAANVYQDKNFPGNRESAARDIADHYFNANYPAGFLGTSHRQGGLTITSTSGSTRLAYAAQAETPLTFGKVLTTSPLRVSTAPEVMFAQGNAGANIVIVLDQSTSIGSWEFHQRVLPAVRAYIDSLDESSTRVAVIVFGGTDTTKLLVPFDPDKPGFDRRKIDNVLAQFRYQGGGTLTGLALELAEQELRKVSGRKVLVLATDGEPGDMPRTSSTSTRLHNQGVTLYGVGFADASGYPPRHEKIRCAIGAVGQASNCSVGIFPTSKYCDGTASGGALQQCLLMQAQTVPAIMALIH